jgi:hypothetical protein
MENKKLPPRLVRNAGVLCLSPSISDGLECNAHDALLQRTECRY